MNCEFRVKLGALLLDDIDPNWYNKIDLDTLQLSSPCHCILGQLYGFYTSALSHVFPLDDTDTKWKEVACGFEATPDSGHEMSFEYSNLQEYWIAEITARRK